MTLDFGERTQSILVDTKGSINDSVTEKKFSPFAKRKANVYDSQMELCGGLTK